MKRQRCLEIPNDALWGVNHRHRQYACLFGRTLPMEHKYPNVLIPKHKKTPDCSTIGGLGAISCLSTEAYDVHTDRCIMGHDTGALSWLSISPSLNVVKKPAISPLPGKGYPKHLLWMGDTLRVSYAFSSDLASFDLVTMLPLRPLVGCPTYIHTAVENTDFIAASCASLPRLYLWSKKDAHHQRLLCSQPILAMDWSNDHIVSIAHKDAVYQYDIRRWDKPWKLWDLLYDAQQLLDGPRGIMVSGLQDLQSDQLSLHAPSRLCRSSVDPKGRFWVGGGEKGALWIWDVQKPRVGKGIQGHPNKRLSCGEDTISALLCTESLLVVGSEKGKLHLFEMA